MTAGAGACPSPARRPPLSAVAGATGRDLSSSPLCRGESSALPCAASTNGRREGAAGWRTPINCSAVLPGLCWAECRLGVPVGRWPMARAPDPPGGVTGPQAELLRLAYGALAAQVVYVAAKLGLADLLKDGPRAAADLAAAAGVDAALPAALPARPGEPRGPRRDGGRPLRADRDGPVPADRSRGLGPAARHLQHRGAPAALGRAAPHPPHRRVRGRARPGDVALRVLRRASGDRGPLRPDHGQRRPLTASARPSPPTTSGGSGPSWTSAGGTGRS